MNENKENVHWNFERIWNDSMTERILHSSLNGIEFQYIANHIC